MTASLAETRTRLASFATGQRVLVVDAAALSVALAFNAPPEATELTEQLWPRRVPNSSGKANPQKRAERKRQRKARRKSR